MEEKTKDGSEALPERVALQFRCVYCGRFIPGDHFDNGLAGMHFTPDTLYTTEKAEYYHYRCDRQYRTPQASAEAQPEPSNPQQEN